MITHSPSLPINTAGLLRVLVAAVCLASGFIIASSEAGTADDSNWILQSSSESNGIDDSNWNLDDGAGTKTRNRAADLHDAVLENARYTIDLSTRATYRTSLDEWAFDQFLGIDYAKTFSSLTGDWGTLNAQFYLTRSDNQWRHPYFIEDENDWELVTRITNFNFTGLADGKFNIRVGHFEIPYGLEVGVNSSGTLRQLLTRPNLGVKTDWGVGINGTLPKFKYEFTLSRGTGNEYHSRGEPFVFAGRIGTADDQESFTGSPSYGISGFYGDVLGANSKITNRLRVGIDATRYLGPFTVLGELSAGQDGDANVVNGLGELNWITPGESTTVYTQVRLLNREFTDEWDDATTSVFGIRYTPDNSWALSAQYEQGWSGFNAANGDGFFAMQARYRF